MLKPAVFIIFLPSLKTRSAHDEHDITFDIEGKISLITNFNKN